MWCVMVQLESPGDREKERISVTFDAEVCDELRRIAAFKKVSLAWVVRDAVDLYLREEIPLLRLGR